MKEDYIVLWMKKYSLSDVLKWIQCTCIHPNNQLYQTRFENLICLLMNIEITEFEGKTLTRRSFSDFIYKYYESSNEQFYFMEDFIQYDQRKKIPYYIKEKKRYFYYGALERSYEDLSKFDYLYSNVEINNNMTLGDLLNISLDFQNDLLIREEEINELGNNMNCIYIPTESYIEDVWELFKIPSNTNKNISVESCFSWSMVKEDTSRLIEIIDKLYINDENNNKIFIIPQLHIEILFNIAKRIIDKDKIKKVEENAIEKFQDIFKKNISFYKKVSSVSYNKQENFNNKWVFYRVDEEILLVFYFYKAGSHIINLADYISEEFEKVLGSDEIVLNYNNIKEEKIIISHTKIMPVVIYENLLINGMVMLENQKVKFNYCELKDLNSFIELLDLNELYKYFEEDMLIEDKFKIIAVDKVDKFGYYIENNKSFFEHGHLPENIYIETHTWSNFYMKYLYEKYSEKIYNFLNNEKPNYFNFIKKIGNDRYECMNKSNLNYWTVLFKGENKVIIRYIKPAVFIKSNNAIKLGEEIIKPLFLEYIDKIYEEVNLDFKLANFSFGSKYYIEMVPFEMIHEFRMLKEYVSLISEEKPIVVRTLYNNKENTHHTFIIYDSKKMLKIFNSEKNYGERYCINQLLYSLALYNFPSGSEQHLIEFSKELTNKYCPIAKRRYGIFQEIAFNPKIQRYSRYIKTNDTEISIVNREIAETLSKTALTKGKYKSVEANRICEMILHYLNEQLRVELSQYNDSIIKYSYRQLEYLEAQRSKNNTERVLDLGTDTDFDVFEKAKEQFEENSKYGLGIKHIIHAIMKYGCNGRVNISEERWKRLLAIAFVTNEMALIYDMAKYNLQAYEVEVTEFFEVKDNLKELIFSGQDYSNKMIEHKLKKENSKENARELLGNINRIYEEEFGVEFYDIVNILQLLGELDLESNNWEPITYIEREKLINEIKNYFKDLDSEYINKVISYVSLDFETYTNVNYISETNLMRMKERINLSPLLLKDDKVIYGNEMCLKASNLWINYYYNGDVPYSIDLPEAIKKEVKYIHRKLDLELEKELEELSKKILGGKYVEANIDNFRRISNALKAKQSCGEIDLLAINEKTKTIFVIDAKNMNKRLRPYDINQELNDFYNEKKGYLIKLNKKAEYIAENIAVVLEYFKVKNTDGWKVKKSFYVDKIFPSAFVRDDIVFITKLELEEYLNTK